MKVIETSLNENQFLSRLETFCRKKQRFDVGYNDKDVFVFKRKKNKFWLSKHYAYAGRSDGYMKICIHCSYCVNDRGFVSVKYRFGQRPVFMIPLLIACLVGGFISGWVIFDIVKYGSFDWAEIFVASVFWIFGLGNLLIRSKKDKSELDGQLKKICRVQYDE